MPEANTLPRLLFVDEEKCVNCHACIAVCPVKYCNDGSGDHVNINPETCIGCGHCLEECTHDARIYVDDFPAFMDGLSSDEKMVAIVAPSAAANFPKQALAFNGWLKSIGVEAVFDVSFGAELTAKSYAEYIKKEQPDAVIAQPCPAIVTYIEIYQPELLPYLAPVDSPMLHTIKMIRRFYPQYNEHTLAVISPCMAKRREFAETGLGDYNVGYISIERYLRDNGIELDAFPSVDFDNAAPERAVLFSSPGGLLRTMDRWFPGIGTRTRKTEGTPNIYEYLKKLPEIIESGEEGMAPLLVDCLSCEMGCNGGTLTLAKDKSPDEIEYWIEQRNREMQEYYTSRKDHDESGRTIEEVLDDYWEEGLYGRTYVDRSSNARIRIPSDGERDEIYRSMHKYSEEDIFNCSSCGYGRCEHMATAIFNGLNRPENCHHFLADERELSRREIADKEKRLRTILETTIEGFIQVDGNETIVKVNPAMAAIMGSTEEDLLGKSIFDLTDDENGRVFRNQLKIRSENKASTYEITLKNRKGRDVICIFHATPLFDESGKKVGSFALVSDITELKKAEAELREHRNNLEKLVEQRTSELNDANQQLIEANEKLIAMDKVKSDFVSSVSHELRTPLTSILGFAKIIRKKMQDVLLPMIDDSERKVARAKRQVDENIGIIITEGERLTTMINEVLDLAKMEAGKTEWHMAPTSAGEIIERSISATSSLFEEKGLELVTEIEPSLPTVNADTDRLIQVVVNLISNAVKFTDSGTITCRASREGNEIIVSVIDTGMGISREDAPKLFDRFKQVGDTLTNKPKGTGLGLVICKEIIEHHGGRIWFESEIGQGTAFSFTLPTMESHSNRVRIVDRDTIIRQLHDHPWIASPPSIPGKKRILVVDDDRNIRKLLREELEGSLYTIAEAKDGFDAVEQIRRRPPDLIILDVKMPGMSGFDVAAVVKNDPLTIGVPIIVLTVVEERERAEKLGVDRYLTKPVQSQELVESIETLIEAGSNRKRVVVFGREDDLVETLSEIMRSQGYSVTATKDRESFLKTVRESQPDIIIADASNREIMDITAPLEHESGLENTTFLLLGDAEERNNAAADIQ